ncbi:TBC1 domain family member 10B [Geodia barretti]|nr:TBC1 domain family member 10B [Geodia barretti]
MQTCGGIFSLLLKDRQTKLAQHLDSLSIHPLMYITSWFMCLFTTLPCWDTVLTICDLIFLEGYQRLFCGALAILEVCSGMSYT